MRGQSVRNRRKAGETVGSGVEIPVSRPETQSRWSPAFHARAARLEYPPKPELFRPSLEAGERGAQRPADQDSVLTRNESPDLLRGEAG